MPDATLFDRPTLATPPADNDFVWNLDVSDVTDDPDGTDKKQTILLHRTHGDTQVTTFDNAGTIGPVSGEVFLTLTVGSFFRVRSNVGTNLLNVSNAGAVSIEDNLSIISGDININTGDLIVQAGDIDVQSGGADFNADVDMNSNALVNVSNITSNDALFVIINNLAAGVSLTGVGNSLYTINADEVSLTGDLNINLGGIQRRSGAVDPVPADINSGYFSMWENTGTTMQTSGGAVNEIALWNNLGGSMYQSMPLNYEGSVVWTPTAIDTGAGTYVIGTSDCIYDIHGNKAFLSIELTGINSGVAPTGTFRLSNLPFSFVRISPLDVSTFTGGSVNFASISARVVNNAGAAEIEFTIQDAIDANFSTIMQNVTMAGGSMRIAGFMYIS